jgi:hypothetical protein
MSLEIGALDKIKQARIHGEPVALEAPLRFSVDPGALRLLVPDGMPATQEVPPLEAGWQAARALGRWLRPTPATHEAGSDDAQKPMDPNTSVSRRPQQRT